MRILRYLLLLVILLGTGCSGSAICPGKKMEDPSHRAVEALWARRALVIQQTIEVGWFEPREDFDDAVVFFEDLTGIKSNTAGTYGRVPGPSLPDTFAAWQSWYQENRCKTYWDLELQAPCVSTRSPETEPRCAIPLRRQLEQTKSAK